MSQVFALEDAIFVSVVHLERLTSIQQNGFHQHILYNKIFVFLSISFALLLLLIIIIITITINCLLSEKLLVWYNTVDYKRVYNTSLPRSRRSHNINYKSKTKKKKEKIRQETLKQLYTH